MSTVPKYREAQDRLREYIFENQLKAGDRLPVEADLARAFGISRLSLREAIRALAAVGVLKSTQGGGTYVREFSFAPILENMPYAFQLGAKDLKNLLELRAALEEGMIARASAWIRRRDLDDLREIVAAMEHVDPAGEEMAQLDRAFHLRLYEPLDNPLVNQMIDLFWEVSHRLRTASPVPVNSARETAQLHADIVDAIASESGVVQSITNHFEDVRRRLDALTVLDSAPTPPRPIHVSD